MDIDIYCNKLRGSQLDYSRLEVLFLGYRIKTFNNK